MEDWFIISDSPDYFNCAFDRTTLDRSESSIFSGNGSVGLLSSFDEGNSYSESIGQQLTNPLLPGKIYKLAFMASTIKKGVYAEISKYMVLKKNLITTPVSNIYQIKSQLFS